MKAQFMRRAKESLRPYDQVRFSNKMGQGAKLDHGVWIPSTGRTKRRIRNRTGTREPYSMRNQSRSPPRISAEEDNIYMQTGYDQSNDNLNN